MDKYAARRAELKATAKNDSLPMEERFKARLKLAKLPRNSSTDPAAQPLRGHGAPALLLPQAPDVAHRAAGIWPRKGQIPGMVKSSW